MAGYDKRNENRFDNRNENGSRRGNDRARGYASRGARGFEGGGRSDPSFRSRRAGDERRSEERKERREDRSRPRAEQPAFEPREIPENWIIGRNPVREAIRSNRPIDKLLVASGDMEGSAREILRLAKDAGLVIQQIPRATMDEMCGGARHQGFVAYAAAHEYVTVEQILETAKEKGEDPFVILLDGVEDPHNLGSILRTAECCGAHGVIIPRHRAVGLTPVVVKTSAGATEYVPVAKVTNISDAIEQLKNAGLWITGADMDGTPYDQCDLKGPVALVVGGEGAGISALVRKRCDFIASIPMKGRIESLNASVAAAVLICEAARQRR